MSRYQIEQNQFDENDWFINDLIEDTAFGKFPSWGAAFRFKVALECLEIQIRNEGVSDEQD